MFNLPIGPVIGPMVLAGVVIEIKDIPRLKSLGVKDSKELTPLKREHLYKEIISIAKKYKIVKVSAQQIDDALNSPNTNLNFLEGEKMAEIINSLRPEQVVVDCPSNNKEAFGEFLLTKIKVKTKLKCEHKADQKFIEASAASILAKVTRDREVELIKKKIGINFGSGYPSDEITKRFLEENWNKHPEIFRKSWTPYKKLSNSKTQTKLRDF